MTGIVQFVRKNVSYNVFVKHIRGMSQVSTSIYIAEKIGTHYSEQVFSEDDFLVYCA